MRHDYPEILIEALSTAACEAGGHDPVKAAEKLDEWINRATRVYAAKLRQQDPMRQAAGHC